MASQAAGGALWLSSASAARALFVTVSDVAASLSSRSIGSAGPAGASPAAAAWGLDGHVQQQTHQLAASQAPSTASPLWLLPHGPLSMSLGSSATALPAAQQLLTTSRSAWDLRREPFSGFASTLQPVEATAQGLEQGPAHTALHQAQGTSFASMEAPCTEPGMGPGLGMGLGVTSEQGAPWQPRMDWEAPGLDLHGSLLLRRSGLQPVRGNRQKVVHDQTWHRGLRVLRNPSKGCWHIDMGGNSRQQQQEEEGHQGTRKTGSSTGGPKRLWPHDPWTVARKQKSTGSSSSSSKGN